MKSIETLVKDECIRRITESAEKINKSINLLSEAEVWIRPNTQSNSMGNLLLHLCGNITQYIISTLGGVKDERERSKEFSESGPIPTVLLLDKFNKTIEKAAGIIDKMDEQRLAKIYAVQCFDESGAGILIHVTEHLSYHTGQIVYFTKYLKNQDMKFYDDTALENHGNLK